MKAKEFCRASSLLLLICPLLLSACSGAKNNASATAADSKIATGAASALVLSVSSVPSTLKNINSGLCLSVPGSSLLDGVLLKLATCNAATNQKFTYESVGGDRYHIRSTVSHKCVDVFNASKNSGALVAQYTCGMGANQLFTLDASVKGGLSITSVNSGKCIAVLNNSRTVGASLIQNDCSGQEGQSWFSSQVSSSTPTPTPAPTATSTPAPTATPAPVATATPTPAPSGNSALSITSLTLINAQTNQAQAVDGIAGHSAIILDNSAFDLAKVGQALNIRADIQTAASVLFDFDSGAISHIENVAPYALASDQGGVYNSWTPSLGAHTLKVTAYSAADATGTSGSPLVIHFSVSSTSSSIPTPTPVPASTATPAPSTAPPAVGSAEPANYSAPITITQGGTYSGNWKSNDSGVIAVTINAGSAPVIIQNCHIAGPGRLIQLNWGGNLTVKNCYFYGKDPTADNVTRGRAIAAAGFSNLVVENNSFEHTGTVIAMDNYNGDGTANQTLKVRFNLVHNIDGRYRNSGEENANFVAVQNFHGSGGNPRFGEIAWNQVINEPFNSKTEDLINFYSAGGRTDSWFKVHDNLLKGSYSADPVNGNNTGSGMIVDGDQTADSNAKTAFIESYGNTVLSTTNAGMNISAGHDIHYYNNRIISSGKIADGRTLAASWAGVAIWNVASGIYNAVIDNNVIGWAKPGYHSPYNDRQDISANENGGVRNNAFLPDAPITVQMEADEVARFQQKIQAQAIRIGPTP